jgi:ABC-2 type transport system ATP-binding protein
MENLQSRREYGTADLAIEFRNLTKSYGQVQALRGIDLEVGRGEIFGFLGPNGAGKTTAIRCMLDLIRPNSGKLRVLGRDPQANSVEVRKKTGYLPGELSLDDNLNPRQILKLFDRMRGGGVDWEEVSAMAERLQLDLDKAIKNLSKGNKQKVGVIQAFMHHPELLLLDEPTSGLDPLMQKEVVALVREAKASGATVFFSTHILSEAQEVSERIAIVRNGSIVKSGDTSELISQSILRANIVLRVPIEFDELGKLSGIRVLAGSDGHRLKVEISGEMDELFQLLAGHRVTHFETERASLEDVFLALYAGGGEDQ